MIRLRSEYEQSLDRCYTEQRLAAEYIANGGQDTAGAKDGLFDWYAEEVLIRTGEGKHDSFYIRAKCATAHS
jgi:hypothetical protein